MMTSDYVYVCCGRTQEERHADECWGASQRDAVLLLDPNAGMDTFGNPADDPVNNPKHYTSHPSGIECVQITEHMGFCLGNAVKYIWRADLKADAIEDLKKARWYIEREIALRERK
jgi:hypothetical protein